MLPSLSANIEAVNLDLEQLTRTFSFGQISGRIDGFIHDLRMLDWKPVAFDAWFGTPANQTGTRDISRKAVNNLTTLGGGGATTALTGPVMKLFSSFSYKSLGMGCRMQNNVCEIRGVSEDDVQRVDHGRRRCSQGHHQGVQSPRRLAATALPAGSGF